MRIKRFKRRDLRDDWTRKRNRKAKWAVDIVKMILEFNRQQQGQGLKILTPNQMLSRLPISLPQLKAGSNSEKVKNEIRQAFYSLYRSKKTYKTTLQKFGWHYLKMETIFINSQNIKTNEPHRFRLDITDKLTLKQPLKKHDFR